MSDPRSQDPHPHQPASDEADPEKMTSPIGVARDLEAEAPEQGGTTDPADATD